LHAKAVAGDKLEVIEAEVAKGKDKDNKPATFSGIAPVFELRQMVRCRPGDFA
jgi:hypothetical protein